METGDSMEPGQQALRRAEHRGAAEVCGASSLGRVRASAMGHSQYGLPGPCRCFLLFLFSCFLFSFGHSVELRLHHCIGEDNPSSLYSFPH